MALLKKLESARINQFVFPGRSNRKPIAHWAKWALVQRLTGRKEDEPSTASAHGFRASFRSWCTARHISSEVAERCARARAQGRDPSGIRQGGDAGAAPRGDGAVGRYLSGEDVANVVPMRRA